MPLKPLPPELVARLQTVITKYKKRHHRFSKGIYTALGKMKNIDYRKKERDLSPQCIDKWGRRVRQMNVSRTFPGVKLVLKKSHGGTAEEVVLRIKETVREHNKKYGKKEKRYVLLEPYAYTVGKEIIAMAKTSYPELCEIISTEEPESRTKRGLRFFARMKKEHGVNEKQLREAFIRLNNRTGINESNVLLVGFKKGKFVFVPLLDLL